MNTDCQFWITFAKDVLGIALPTWIVAIVALTWKIQMRKKSNMEIADSLISSLSRLKERVKIFRAVRLIYKYEFSELKMDYKKVNTLPDAEKLRRNKEFGEILTGKEWRKLMEEYAHFRAKVIEISDLWKLDHEKLTEHITSLIDTINMERTWIVAKATNQLNPLDDKELERTFPSKPYKNNEKDNFQEEFNSAVDGVISEIRKRI